MEKFYTNTLVIGAGVVGLAIAKEISAKNRETIILEKEAKIGQITSSRNSGVIHAGIYYQSNSLKSKFCVEGNKLLYDYAKKFNVPFINTKKIIVATDESQMEKIFEIKKQATANGVEGLDILNQNQVNQLEPLIKSSGGLYQVEITGSAPARFTVAIGFIESFGTPVENVPNREAGRSGIFDWYENPVSQNPLVLSDDEPVEKDFQEATPVTKAPVFPVPDCA